MIVLVSTIVRPRSTSTGKRFSGHRDYSSARAEASSRLRYSKGVAFS